MGTVVDLFAGCGGMSYGMELAGFNPIYVNELSPYAMETYVRNQPLNSAVRDARYRSHDVYELTRNPEQLAALAADLRHRAGGEVDFVTGGPPCQGFSGIGHRRTFKLEKEEIPSNHLYKEMASVIEAVQPRVFVFENVRGLLSARWTSSGRRGEIWEDVSETLSSIADVHGNRYVVSHALVHAKEFGVPQNRPRVIAVGVRADVAEAAGYHGDWYEVGDTARPPDPQDLLGDLCEKRWSPGGATVAYPTDPLTEAQRSLRTRRDGSVMGKGEPLTEQEYSRHSSDVQERFHRIRRGISVPDRLQTKKFNLRPIPARWPQDGPNLTVASLPDDFVHYAEDRAPTVREWARLQGFPDWYQFSGPRTTGGRKRAGDPSANEWHRDLPKYTQIGNAVPVALAEWLGRRMDSLLNLRHADDD